MASSGLNLNPQNLTRSHARALVSSSLCPVSPTSPVLDRALPSEPLSPPIALRTPGWCWGGGGKVPGTRALVPWPFLLPSLYCGALGRLDGCPPRAGKPLKTQAPPPYQSGRRRVRCAKGAQFPGGARGGGETTESAERSLGPSPSGAGDSGEAGADGQGGGGARVPLKRGRRDSARVCGASARPVPDPWPRPAPRPSLGVGVRSQSRLQKKGASSGHSGCPSPAQRLDPSLGCSRRVALVGGSEEGCPRAALWTVRRPRRELPGAAGGAAVGRAWGLEVCINPGDGGLGEAEIIVWRGEVGRLWGRSDSTAGRARGRPGFDPSTPNGPEHR